MIILRDLEKLVWTGFALLTLCAVSVRASVVVDLAVIDQADIQVSGEIFNDESGTSVASGDINGDGKQDLIIGVPHAHWGGSDPGEVVVIWGSSAFPSPHNLDLAFATKNLLVKGKANDDRLGFAVASGDINGDGIDDLIVGAPFADPAGRLNAGEIYVFYGSTGFGPSQTIDLSLAGVPDLTLQGVEAADYWGKYLSTGDINGDGIDDILFTSTRADYNDIPSRSNCGVAMVVYGSASFLPNEVRDLASGADITVYGDFAYEYLGSGIAAGELNGLPGEDLLIGGWAVDGPSGRTNSGVVYAIWGSTSFAPNHIINNPRSQAGFTLWGSKANDYLGMSVAAGDFNDDGLDDILVGAVGADPSFSRQNAGEAYVIYGSLSLPLIWDLDNGATPADIEIRGVKTDDGLGQSVGSTDMKNDGIQDMIIGAPLADPKGRGDAGSVFVVNGSTSFPPAHVIDLLVPGQADLEVIGKQAGDMLGASVAGGDMGGDSFGDILVGAPKSDPLGRTWAGESYVIYGKPDSTPTPTATFTQSETWTSTPTFTLTHTPAFSSTQTQSATQTATLTDTLTNTPSFTVTATFTETHTKSPSLTSTPTTTITATFTETQTESPSPTYSPTFTYTLTEVESPTATPTHSPTRTESPTLTASPTLTETTSPTLSSTVSPTPTWTMTFTALESETMTTTQTATSTLTPPLTFTLTPTVTVTDTYTATATSTATFTATSTTTASPTATVFDTVTPTPALTATLSVTPSLTPTGLATSTATLTFTPTPALPETVQAWPNPFRPSDAVRGTVKIGPVSSEASVVLYTLAGERLRTLRAGTNSPVTWDVWTLSGSQRTKATVLEWDGRTESGLDVVAGLYFFVVEEEGRSVARGKIAVIR